MIKRLLFAVALAIVLPLKASAALFVSVNVAPPPLPVYAQPVIPAPGYLWTPGYWRWSPVDEDYFWVPGTWVAPPYVGALWTPGYWGWAGGNYLWHGGYWGPHVGFYGGVNYGFGYIGSGYHGGYWNGGVFNYNRSVNNINTTIVHNVYNTTVVEHNTRVSFNGGQGGINARPSHEEQIARGEQHSGATSVQRQHEQFAMQSPEQRASFNHGSPTLAATPRGHEFRATNGQQPGNRTGGDPMRAQGGGERVHAQGGGERARGPSVDRPHPEHAGGDGGHREGHVDHREGNQR
jgi:WXXGXW repeat (2 copies)